MKDVREILNRLPEGQQTAMAVAVLWAIFAMVRNLGLMGIPAVLPGLLAVIAFLLALPWKSKMSEYKEASQNSQKRNKYNLRINIPLGLLLLWMGVSIILHPNPLFGLRSMRYIFLIFSMLLLSPLVLTETLTKIRKVTATVILALAGTAVAVSMLIWIILELSNIDYIHTRFFHFGFCGLFTNGVAFSLLSGVLAIVSLEALLTFNRRRWLCGVALFIFVCGCVLGGSRIALCGMILGSLILAGFRLNRIIQLFKNSKAILFALGMSAIGAMVLPLLSDMIIEKQQFAAEHGSLFASRTRLWNARLYEITHYPLTGIGYANELRVHTVDVPDPSVKDDFDTILGEDFNFNPELYVEPEVSEQPTPRLQYPQTIEPGSSWLSVISQGGIPAAIFLLWFFIDIFRKARTNRNSSLFPLCFSLLFFFLISGCTEGWLLYAGTIHFSLFWLNVSLLSDTSRQ